MAATEDASIDRVGLSWRPELAHAIYLADASIDCIEVLAEPFFRAPRRQVGMLRELARSKPVILHGVAMGLSSTQAPPLAHMDRMARLVEAVEPMGWSEHLAMVRADRVEIGHLAAPVYCPEVVEATIRNAALAQRIVGAPAALENVAVLLDLPGLPLSEVAFTREVAAASAGGLLLDLHNLYANARMRGHDPLAMMRAMPIATATVIHIAGGKWVLRPGSSPRLLDDHLHDPPEEVYDLLEELAATVSQRLTVILERDGAHPPFERTLAQLERIRLALRRGRGRAARPRAMEGFDGQARVRCLEPGT